MQFGLTNKELFDGGILIMLVGPPGSGKSTIAKSIKEQYMNFEIICPDDIRKEITGDPKDQTKNAKVFNKVYSRLSYFLNEGYNVVYDATNCRSTYRYRVLDTCKNVAKKIICIMVATPIRECLERNKTRCEDHVPEDVIENMYFSLKKHPPTIFEGYDAIFKA